MFYKCPYCVYNYICVNGSTDIIVAIVTDMGLPHYCCYCTNGADIASIDCTKSPIKLPPPKTMEEHIDNGFVLMSSDYHNGDKIPQHNTSEMLICVTVTQLEFIFS